LACASAVIGRRPAARSAATAGAQARRWGEHHRGGAVVDEDALVDALRGGRLAAAGLDVFEGEPVTSDNPLLGLDNMALTPHVTWYTADTMRRYLAEAVANCRRLRDGNPLANVVNQPTGY
jgi:phosphoglycerate dehydrogenase-like enzyme